MTTKVADRVMLDTNVLLIATDSGRAEHKKALEVVNDWPRQGTVLYASGQIMREYLAVATRPVKVNGLGMNQADAVANVRAFRGRTRLLSEDSKVSDCLLDLLAEVSCRGKQTHDANIVATMLIHGIETIVTMNVDDFARFSNYVQPIALAG